MAMPSIHNLRKRARAFNFVIVSHGKDPWNYLTEYTLGAADTDHDELCPLTIYGIEAAIEALETEAARGPAS